MKRRLRPWATIAVLVAVIAGLGVLLRWRRTPAPEPGSRSVRARANRALDLALSGKREAVPALLAFVHDRAPVVQDNALFGLRRLTGLAWRERTPDCLAWWQSEGSRGASAPTDLLVREPPVARDPEIAFTLALKHGPDILLGDDTVPLTVRWTLVHSGARPVVLRTAPRDVHFAYRFLADGSAALVDESLLPWAWVTVSVRGLRFGPDALPREIACEEGRTLDGLRLAPGQEHDASAGWPVPGSGDPAAGFAVFELRLRVEPYFRDGVPGIPWVPPAVAPVFATARPRWRAETPHLSPAERTRVIEEGRAAGLEPARLTILRIRAEPGGGEGANDGTAVERAWRGRLNGPRGALRPWVFVSGVGWVLVEDDPAAGPPGSGPLVPTLTLAAALPGLRAGEFAWAVEFE